jgi:HSP20 family molecular chaperone IbpA
MNTIVRWEPLTLLEDRVNRLFDPSFTRTTESDLATWAPAVDIFETEHELVVKADLPDVPEKDYRCPRREQHTINSRRT